MKITMLLNKLGLYTRKQLLNELNRSLAEHEGNEPMTYQCRLYTWGGYSAVENVKHRLFGIEAAYEKNF